MKPQALAHDTTIYYHTRWTCTSCDTVQGKHIGVEPVVRVDEGVCVSLWILSKSSVMAMLLACVK